MILEEHKIKNAKEFIKNWTNKGYEKGESQKFWIELLTKVYGVENITEFIKFEDTVKLDKTTGFIDGIISETHVLIEQKSINKDLKSPIKQSDGTLLTPYEQAKRYNNELPFSKKSRWIVLCNFKSFLIYDMERLNSEPEEILLKDLDKEYYRMNFLVEKENEHIKKEEEISFQAGELVGELYDAFSKEYRNIEDEQAQKDLNELCVRIVFCLYAEDSGLFGKRSAFHDYLSRYENLSDMRKALKDLFKILDTPYDKRDVYEDELNVFPYVNGGLFSNENIEIPKFTERIRKTLLSDASDNFNWSDISPTIFGAVFESTLNPETRRSGGMHYISIENIHKVIDPLFLNDLKNEFKEIKEIKNIRTRRGKLEEFQNKIAKLKFFDPACGSGNFLTETYISLRKLENEILDELQENMMFEDMGNIIKVSIQQFYGIEINDFAVKVAKTALWIAEAQMWEKTRNRLSSNLKLSDFLPLETYENIFEGSALSVNWEEVLPSTECSYIIGNPPFIGAMVMTKKQHEDIKEVFEGLKVSGEFDYVTAWYKLACDYMENTQIKCAFVSTNSICQGQHVITFWKYIIEKYNAKIIFAHKTFNWESEAKNNAKVHCVIVGFTRGGKDFTNKCILYTSTSKYEICDKINPYLIPGDNYFIESRSTPICYVSSMRFGSMPRDGGNLILTEQEKDEILKEEPKLEKWIRPYVGAEEFINNKKRYCLWLVGIEPNEINSSNFLKKRIKACKEFRENSKAPSTRKFAEIPYLFCQIAQPDTDYLLVPSTSSEKRKYIPMGFLNRKIIANNATQIIPNATLYEFGVLTSNVHMAWMRTVAGRLKRDYRYSKDIVYNNFPWPEPTKEQKDRIEKTAKQILEVRKKYKNSSLAELYDEITMPIELREAHRENDKTVMEAYGFRGQKMKESECVRRLIELYKKIIDKE